MPRAAAVHTITHIYVLSTGEHHVPIRIPKPYVRVNSVMVNIDNKIFMRRI